MNKSSVFMKMLDELPLDADELRNLILNAPHTYKIYEIPKRTGSTRTISQPAKGTKYLQYWLIDNYLSELPVHDCALAYRRGLSIKSNAEKHRLNPYLAKFDFKDFFVSIKGDDFRNHLKSFFADNLSEDDISLMERVCFIKRRKSEPYSLTIGSPSSPVISNSILYQFDEIVNKWCLANKVIYTRYADDLVFSTRIKGKTSEIEAVVRAAIREINYPSLRLNSKKTTQVSKKYQRRVTGLILTNDGEVSIGRERKRQISSLVHKFKLNSLDEESISRLQGYLAYSMDVEPDFVKRLSRKYGDSTIEELVHNVPRKTKFPFG